MTPNMYMQYSRHRTYQDVTEFDTSFIYKTKMKLPKHKTSKTYFHSDKKGQLNDHRLQLKNQECTR